MYVRMIQLLQRKKNNVDTEDRAEECRYDSQIVMRHGAYGCNSTREYTCQDMKKSTAIKSFLPINHTNSSSYTYLVVTEDPLAVVEVKTVLFCSMSTRVTLHPDGV